MHAERSSASPASYVALIGLLFLVVISSCKSTSLPGNGTSSKVSGAPVVSHTTTPWDENQSKGEGAYQDVILDALANSDGSSTEIHFDSKVVDEIFENWESEFLNYLSVNPAWRVFEKSGNRYATRRWNINNNWKYSSHGYYTRFALRMKKPQVPNFENRFTIGLDNHPWIKNQDKATSLKNGEKANLTLESNGKSYKSFCLLNFEQSLFEIFEESYSKDRSLTRAALEYTRRELASFKEHIISGDFRELLTASSIKTGNPSFQLHQGRQAGIYDSEIWINPGEPGKLYLKAFDVGSGVRLSKDGLNRFSNEWVGWSKDSQELFYSNSRITIKEGERDNFYDARFEIWFVPDSGKREKKLMEKVFSIDGWQR